MGSMASNSERKFKNALVKYRLLVKQDLLKLCRNLMTSPARKEEDRK